VGMGVLSAFGAALAVGGLSLVRGSTAGRYEPTLAPADPGYQARVVPTPTMALVHRGADGALAGVSLLALEPGDEGGSVVVVPPSTLLTGSPGQTTIAETYRDDGVEAAVSAVAEVMTVAVAEHVEIDDTHWARLVTPVGPVEVSLDDPVGEWSAGTVALDADEVGRFLTLRADGETDLDRLERQEQFWSAWLSLVAEGGDDAVPGEVDTGVGRFVRGIARGTVVTSGLPVARVDGPGAARFRPEADRIAELVARAVPYPTAARPGGRIRVRLLNGTRSADLTTPAARALVAGGAEIVVAGNAPTFDVAETSLLPSDAERHNLAVWLQAILGGGRVERMPGGQVGEGGQAAPDEEIDVTVILGDDAGDLIRR
jgi:hypothetical protein